MPGRRRRGGEDDDDSDVVSAEMVSDAGSSEESEGSWEGRGGRRRKSKRTTQRVSYNEASDDEGGRGPPAQGYGVPGYGAPYGQQYNPTPRPYGAPIFSVAAPVTGGYGDPNGYGQTYGGYPPQAPYAQPGYPGQPPYGAQVPYGGYVGGPPGPYGDPGYGGPAYAEEYDAPPEPPPEEEIEEPVEEEEELVMQQDSSAPAGGEEAIEKLLSRREIKDDEGKTVEEFLVKYKMKAYMHAKWVRRDILEQDRAGKGRILRFIAKEAELLVSNMGESFNPEYLEIDRIIGMDYVTQYDGTRLPVYFVKWCELPYTDCTWEYGEDIQAAEKINEFHQRQVLPPMPVGEVHRDPSGFRPFAESPKYKDEHTLRDYQLEGLNWLMHCWHFGRNSILADEMGLGKTVQIVSIINYLFSVQRIPGPFLCVAPLSTIQHWKREFEGWTEMNVVVYHGSAAARDIMREREFYFFDERRRQIPGVYKFNVLVTTYEMILADAEHLRRIRWKYGCIDEAHRLKNNESKIIEMLRQFRFDHLTLLTGTPLQNNIRELWSLLAFLEPREFANYDRFMHQFGNMEDASQIEKLQGLLRPRMLRRLKGDVEKSITPKEETIIEVELTSLQKQYYRAIMERNFSFLSKGGKASNVPNLLNIMMELRKCCNHPFLLKGVEQMEQKSSGVHERAKGLIAASGKMVLIDKLLPKLKDQGHKLLIFSQMTRVLDLLEDYLCYKGYKFERIDGAVRGDARQASIDRFCDPNSDRFVFLLCTRAGGVGINLTAADTVIIYDSDWNPQNDIQAQARCHRIGQTQAVKVYRLITHNTYERQMFDRASLKLGLDQAVLTKMGGKGPDDKPTGPVSKELKEDINKLLKFGAYGALMDEENDEANKFCEEDIDQILERRTTVISGTEEMSSFSKATFSSNKTSKDIDIDDPQFWEKFAAKAKLETNASALDENIVYGSRQRKQVQRYSGAELDEDSADAAGGGGGHSSMATRRKKGAAEDDDAFVDEEEEEDDEDAGGNRKWAAAHRQRLQQALFSLGFGRWADIKRVTKLKHSEASINRYATGILRICITAVMDETLKQLGNDLIEKYSTKNLATMVLPPLLQAPDYQDMLGKKARTLLKRLQMVGLVADIVTAANFDPNKIDISDEVWEEPLRAGMEWWTIDDDRCLLYGTFIHGMGRYDAMRADPTLVFHGRVQQKGAGDKGKKGEGDDDGDGDDKDDDDDDDAPKKKKKGKAPAKAAAKKEKAAAPARSGRRRGTRGAEAEKIEPDEGTDAKHSPSSAAPPALARRDRGEDDDSTDAPRSKRDGATSPKRHTSPKRATSPAKRATSPAKRATSPKRDFSRAKAEPHVKQEDGASSDHAPAEAVVKREAKREPKEEEGEEGEIREGATPSAMDTDKDGKGGAAAMAPKAEPTPQVLHPWPSNSDLLDRLKKLIKPYQAKQRQAMKEAKDKKKLAERAAAKSKREEEKRVRTAKKAQEEKRWKRNERADMLKNLMMYGLPLTEDGQATDWDLLRQLALLHKKTPEMVEEYYHALDKHCQEVLASGPSAQRRQPQADEDDGGPRLTYDQAKKLKKRLHMLRTLREQTIMAPDLLNKLSNVPRSPMLPSWWKTGAYDIGLLQGVLKYGFGSWEQIVEDKELPFHKAKLHFEARQKAQRTAGTAKDVRRWEFPKDKPIAQRIEAINRYIAGGTAEFAVDAGSDDSDDETKRGGRYRGRKAPAPPPVVEPVFEEDNDDDFVPAFPSSLPSVPPKPYVPPKPKREFAVTFTDTTKIARTEEGDNSVKHKEPGLWLKFKPLFVASKPFGDALIPRKPPKSKFTGVIERDPATGRPILPIKVGSIRIISLGTIVHDRPLFHNEKYIWPVGFKSSRSFTSLLDTRRKVEYTSVIEDGGDKPMFTIIPSDAPDQFVTQDTSSGAWHTMLSRVNDIKYKDSGKKPANSISGPSYFGFADPVVISLIEELPNAKLCSRYGMPVREDARANAVESRATDMEGAGADDDDGDDGDAGDDDRDRGDDHGGDGGDDAGDHGAQTKSGDDGAADAADSVAPMETTTADAEADADSARDDAEAVAEAPHAAGGDQAEEAFAEEEEFLNEEESPTVGEAALATPMETEGREGDAAFDGSMNGVEDEPREDGAEPEGMEAEGMES